jgi:hypothetical protein
VVENLKRWLKMREDYGGAKKHKVCIYNNINMLNIHEMTRMVELGKEWGVDKMIMLPTYDQSGVVKLGELMLCPKNVKWFKKASEEAMQRANEIGLQLIYSKRFDAVPPSIDVEPQNLVQIQIPNRV